MQDYLAQKKPPRINVYIDGFNLYHGLKHSGLRRAYWLDLVRLAERLCEGRGQLERVRYFTSDVQSPPVELENWQRQRVYLAALSTLSRLEVIKGVFQTKRITCQTCEATWLVPGEKMTDVNIACHVLRDAVLKNMDHAIIVSADGDLRCLLETLPLVAPDITTSIALPTGRSKAWALRSVCSGVVEISGRMVLDSQLPDAVAGDGFQVHRPDHWR